MAAGNLFTNMSTAEWIVNLAFHSLLVLLMGWLFIWVLRRKSAPLRSKIMFVTMLALLLLPLFSVTYLSFDIAFYKTSLPFTGDSRLSSSQFSDSEISVVADEHNTPASLPEESAASPEKHSNLGVLFQSILSRITTAHVINGVGIIWLLGFLLLLGRLLYGANSLNGFKKGLTKIEDVRLDNILRQAQKSFRLRSLPEVYASKSAKSPVVLGLARPLIVLPQRVYRKLSNKEIRSILFHELSHIYHKDQVTGVLQRIVTALYWWNPFVHNLSTDFSKAREEISDNYAIMGNTSREYAECLVNLAEKTVLVNRLPFLRGLAIPHIPLKDRITQILSKERIMATETKKSTTLIILLGFIVSLGLLTGHKLTFASGKTEIKAEIVKEAASTIQEKQEQEKEKKKKQEQAKEREKKEKQEELAEEKEQAQEGEQAKEEEQVMEEQQIKEGEHAVEEEPEKMKEQMKEEELVIEEEFAIEEAQEEVIKIEETLRELSVEVSEFNVDIEPIELQEKALSAEQEERIRKMLEELKIAISEVKLNVEAIQCQKKTLSAEEKEELRKKLKELSVKISAMNKELAHKVRVAVAKDLKLAHPIRVDVTKDLKLARSIRVDATKNLKLAHEFKFDKAIDLKLKPGVRIDLERDFEVDTEGNVSVKVKPVIVVKVTPKFPEEAKEKGIYGEVEVEGTTDKEGNVISVKVLKSGHKLLDEAVIAAVKQWKYELPEYKGKPYAITFVVTVHFSLKDKDKN
jgi:TonB family protein